MTLIPILSATMKTNTVLREIMKSWLQNNLCWIVYKNFAVHLNSDRFTKRSCLFLIWTQFWKSWPLTRLLSSFCLRWTILQLSRSIWKLNFSTNCQKFSKKCSKVRAENRMKTLSIYWLDIFTPSSLKCSWFLRSKFNQKASKVYLKSPRKSFLTKMKLYSWPKTCKNFFWTKSIPAKR